MVTNMYNKEMLCVRLCDRLWHDKSRVVLITLCDQHPPHFMDEETEGRDFPTFSQGVHVVLRRARSCPGGSLVPLCSNGQYSSGFTSLSHSPWPYLGYRFTIMCLLPFSLMNQWFWGHISPGKYLPKNQSLTWTWPRDDGNPPCRVGECRLSLCGLERISLPTHVLLSASLGDVEMGSKVLILPYAHLMPLGTSFHSLNHFHPGINLVPDFCSFANSVSSPWDNLLLLTSPRQTYLFFKTQLKEPFPPSPHRTVASLFVQLFLQHTFLVHPVIYKGVFTCLPYWDEFSGERSCRLFPSSSSVCSRCFHTGGIQDPFAE